MVIYGGNVKAQGDISKKSRKYMNKNIGCNIFIVG
jgi:hypothetical protein